MDKQMTLFQLLGWCLVSGLMWVGIIKGAVRLWGMLQ
jgi:hypothetical protein